MGSIADGRDDHKDHEDRDLPLHVSPREHRDLARRVADIELVLAEFTATATSAHPPGFYHDEVERALDSMRVRASARLRERAAMAKAFTGKDGGGE